MSDAGDRTHDATPRRRQDARREGRVAKSADLAAAACLVVAGGALAAMVPSIAAGLLSLARHWWGEAAVSQTRADAATAFDPGDELASPALQEALQGALFVGLEALFPILLVCAAAGLLATIVQVGLVFSLKAIKPDIKRISPVAGAKRLFSASRLMVIGRAAAALLLSLGLTASLTRTLIPDILSMPKGSSEALASLLGSHLPSLIFGCGLVLLAPGALDLLLARRRLEKELRMTHREVRDEQKREEGDPFFKGQRRKTQRELASSDCKPLRDAKALIVNPTHLAVALHHGADMPIPTVGVRGRGESAATMRKEARALGIPIIRDVTLARALIALDPGSSVPEPLFAAVAAVLAAVYRAELKSKLQ